MTAREGASPSRAAVLSELAGTAVLVLVGLSCVILLWGEGGPGPRLVPDEGLRRAVNGLLFGATGASIALSPLGKASGAHINPVVTAGFWLAGKLPGRTALAYVSAQLAGAVLGCLPLLLFGDVGRSVAFGATLPGAAYTTGAVFAGEVATTFAMFALLCVFLAFRELRRFTPALFPPLYALMVFLEAPVSGTSTNPARSLGPAVVSGRWDGWWIYWAGPFLGMAVALLVLRAVARRIEEAKLYHFEGGTRRRLRPGGSAAA